MKILILCTGNSCRSQMAEAFLRALNPALDVRSAGTRPATEVHPKAIAAMREVGIDLTAASPKSVDRFLDEPFDYVLTVCDNARETCPLFTGNVRHRLHIGFEDPAHATGSEEKVMAIFRRVRAEIQREMGRLYVEEILPELNRRNP
jgi:arsenate reductase